MSVNAVITDLQVNINDVIRHMFDGITNNDWSYIAYAYELLTGDDSPELPNEEVSPDLQAILARLEKLEQQPKSNTRKTPAKKKTPTVKKK